MARPVERAESLGDELPLPSGTKTPRFTRGKTYGSSVVGSNLERLYRHRVGDRGRMNLPKHMRSLGVADCGIAGVAVHIRRGSERSTVQS
jgi:hypothetical protein